MLAGRGGCEVAGVGKGRDPVTLQAIAARAGFSVSTVSLALRNDRRLRADTRATIQAVAKELGYRPNPLIAVLMADWLLLSAVAACAKPPWSITAASTAHCSSEVRGMLTQRE